MIFVMGLMACQTEPTVSSKSKVDQTEMALPIKNELPDPTPPAPESDGLQSLQLQLADGRQVLLSTDQSCYVFNLTAEEISDGKETPLFVNPASASRVKVDCPSDMSQPPWTLCVEGRILRDSNQGCVCRYLAGGADQIIGCPTENPNQKSLNPLHKDARKIYLGDGETCFVYDRSVVAPPDAKPEDLGPTLTVNCPSGLTAAPWTDCRHREIVVDSSGKCYCQPARAFGPEPKEIACPNP